MFIWWSLTELPNLNLPIFLQWRFRAQQPNLIPTNMYGIIWHHAAANYCCEGSWCVAMPKRVVMTSTITWHATLLFQKRVCVCNLQANKFAIIILGDWMAIPFQCQVLHGDPDWTAKFPSPLLTPTNVYCYTVIFLLSHIHVQSLRTLHKVRRMHITYKVTTPLIYPCHIHLGYSLSTSLPTLRENESWHAR